MGVKLPGRSRSPNENTGLIQQGIAQPRAINNACIPHMELAPASHSSESQQILFFSSLLCVCGVVGGSGRRESCSEVLCLSAFTSCSSSSLPKSLLPELCQTSSTAKLPGRAGIAAGFGKQMGLMCSAKRRF